MKWTQMQLEKAKDAISQRLKAFKLPAFGIIQPEGGEASETVRSILVVLFPYFAGYQKGNLSLYCRGLDYHEVVPQYLNPIGEEVKRILGTDFSYHAYADTGPFIDRQLAQRAGLGFVGDNQMLIHEEYGSYFFIGYLTMNAPFSPDIRYKTDMPQECLHCGRCQQACPGQALPIKKGEAFKSERCRSGISQKSGELKTWEIAILKKDEIIFGCDLCQTVCPYNQNLELSPLPEFTENCVTSLRKEDLEGLSRKQLMERYPNRAFVWRGPAVLRRNLTLLESDEKGIKNGD